MYRVFRVSVRRVQDRCRSVVQRFGCDGRTHATCVEVLTSEPSGEFVCKEIIGIQPIGTCDHETCLGLDVLGRDFGQFCSE